MSRLSSIRQLDTSSPEALKRDLGRLVETIDKELDAIAAQRLFEWEEVTALQRGVVRANFGQLVRIDATPGSAEPHVHLPRAAAGDVGKRVGVTVNAPSPTCILVAHGVVGQPIHTALVATLVSSTLAIRSLTWGGTSWELGY